MDVRQLSFFVTVAEELHFGRAATRLQVAQPAVSQQVARLERELGVRLFDRSSRVVGLSSAGRSLLPQARRVLDEVDRTRRLAEDLVRGDSGELRLGTNEGMGWRLQRVLMAFRQARSDVSVAVTTAHAPAKIAALRAREIDCAFIRSAPDDDDLALLHVWDEPLLAVLPQRHPLAALPEVPLTALRDLPVMIIPRSDNPGVFDAFTARCRQAGFEPVLGPAYRSAEDALANIAASEDTWSPFHASHNALVEGGQAPGVAVRPFADLHVSARCSLAWLRDDAPPSVPPFVEVVRRLRDGGALED